MRRVALVTEQAYLRGCASFTAVMISTGRFVDTRQSIAFLSIVWYLMYSWSGVFGRMLVWPPHMYAACMYACMAITSIKADWASTGCFCFFVPVHAWEFGLVRQVRRSRPASARSFSTPSPNMVYIIIVTGSSPSSRFPRYLLLIRRP